MDMVYEWQDMEVTFRVINKKGVDSEVLYPLYPPPEASSAVPWSAKKYCSNKALFSPKHLLIFSKFKL